MKSLLKTENLNVSYNGFRILQDINISINQGEILGIVGESGSGKSTLLKAITGLLGNGASIDSGSIVFDNKNLINLSNEELRNIRGSKISMIFQNPGASLCPIRTIENQFIETVQSHEKTSLSDIKCRISEIFSKINLKDVDRILKSYPFELSGGMNQRVGIALAMITNPSLILADEPTSALDVTVQAQVVKTLMNLRENFGSSIIMVTHNIGVVSYMVDRIAVMYAGDIVEYGNKKDIITNPIHPYTQLLIKSTPNMKSDELIEISGKPPTFGEQFEGCPFVSRCSKQIEKCKYKRPYAFEKEGRIVACHLYDETKEVKIR
jgi:oligopeptide/dipeptide ABC transporter ATP-binding protein